jgi:putative DNA primase/helicase
VERLARIDVQVRDDAWDANTDILVCRNGTLHIPSGELQVHDPFNRATSGVPYDYDPEAEAPMWGKFLNDFVDAETIHFLQEFAGYCLTTDTGHELALWLTGRPGSGRSTFLAGLWAMLGEKAGKLGLGEIERSRFAMARVPGKTLLVSTEQPLNFVRASDVINELISGAPVTVDEKFKPAYEVIPRAKIAWAMNDLPRIPSANDGLFRRVKVVDIIPIPESERDPSVKETINEEGAGILNWALEGLNWLRKREHFEIPQQVGTTTRRWQQTNDIPALFVAEECETGEDKSVRGKKLYSSYRHWCERNGFKPKSINAVAEDWRRLGFESGRSKQGVIWYGLEVTDAVPSLGGFGG